MRKPGEEDIQKSIHYTLVTYHIAKSKEMFKRTVIVRGPNTADVCILNFTTVSSPPKESKRKGDPKYIGSLWIKTC